MLVSCPVTDGAKACLKALRKEKGERRKEKGKSISKIPSLEG